MQGVTFMIVTAVAIGAVRLRATANGALRGLRWA